VGRAKHVVTIHDLVFLLFQDKHGPTQRRYLEYMVRQSVSGADRVIAVSHNTGRDVVRLLDVPAEKVVVVPSAAGTEFKPLDEPEIENFRRLKGLPNQFFLYLGTLEPRKNIPALIQAYAHLRSLQKNAPLLVIAGGKGWNYERIFELVKELELEDHVLFPGFVPRDEVVLWFNAATAFIYLSEYEGFGLPPLQAMACRVPVIVNNVSSLPEVVGDGGYVLDANSPQQVAKALLGLANDPTLHQEMADRALARSQEFSWNRAARETLAVYEAARAG
jgi:glycosyltransferase involved in cell wall biosynthesis